MGASPLTLVLLVLLPICSGQARGSVPGGAAWKGDMHPQTVGWENPTCNRVTLTGCAPTYAQLKNNGALWKCPDGAPTKGTCGYNGCVKSAGGGGNPLCRGQLNDTSPCCCPKDGCYTLPRYNTVIGVCRGEGCGCGDSTAKSCAPQGNPEQCGGSYGGKPCTGPDVRCCFGANVEELVPFYDLGSQALINYWAAYEYDPETSQWVMQEESSFNTDGSRPTCNLTAPYCGLDDPKQAWLAPQPGGSAFWSLGYYPAGVDGVGNTASMWVLSTEQFWGATWYMLNQLTLDRGPASSMPADECAITNDNCWAAGNAGEMDFLETGWNLANISDDPEYQRSFSTQFNQIGRCFNGGVNGGGFHSPNWLATSPPLFPGRGGEPEPVVYVAVVDSVGNWVYRIPAAEASEIWPGISRKSTAPRLQAHPSRAPSAVNPCTSGFCAVFTSNCQAKNITEAREQGCGFNGDQGYCGNIWSAFANTKQPLFPNSTCERDVRGGKRMPWCLEMVNKASPSPSPGPGPSPSPGPTQACPACTESQCAGEGCGKSVPYLCLGGLAKGGCTSNPDGWPSSGACTGCCDSIQCPLADPYFAARISSRKSSAAP